MSAAGTKIQDIIRYITISSSTAAAAQDLGKIKNSRRKKQEEM